MKKATISIKELPEQDYVFYDEGDYIVSVTHQQTGVMNFTHKFTISDDIQESVKMKEQIMEEFDKLMQKIRDWK